MGRSREIDPDGVGVVVNLRMRTDIIEMLDLLRVDERPTRSRSAIIREATNEWVKRKMKERQGE